MTENRRWCYTQCARGAPHMPTDVWVTLRNMLNHDLAALVCAHAIDPCRVCLVINWPHVTLHTWAFCSWRCYCST